MNNYQKFEEKIEGYLKQPHTKDQIISYLLSIKEFNSFEDWKMIILGLFFVDDIRTDYPEKIIESIHSAQDNYGKTNVDEFLICYLKEESDINKDFSNFFYHLNQQFKHQKKETFSKESVNLICNRRLEKYTQNGTDIDKAFSHFYSCWDYVDEKNVVHITNEALTIMRRFIEKFPKEYLEFIIRPKYIPAKSRLDGNYYSFVLEPFTDNIFDGWDKFKEFLNNQKEVYPVITGYVSEFYERYKKNSFMYVGILDNELDNFGDLIRKWID